MTAQAGEKVITIHILPNISRSKGNQAIKFGQLIKNCMRNFFLQKSWRKWDRETSPRPLFVFWKNFIQDKASRQYVSLRIFW